MPGSIMRYDVAVGDNVSVGDTLLVLEAMKMENPIKSPVAGRVVSIESTPGTAVQTGTLLLVIA